MRSKHIGSSLDSFLEEAGIKDEVYLKAKKTVLVDQIRRLMDKRKITKAGSRSTGSSTRTTRGSHWRPFRRRPAHSKRTSRW